MPYWLSNFNKILFEMDINILSNALDVNLIQIGHRDACIILFELFFGILWNFEPFFHWIHI